jgi:hypothetical protein
MKQQGVPSGRNDGISAVPMLIAIASAVTKQAAKRASFKVNDMVRLPRFGLDTFRNPLVYTFAGVHGSTIMTLSRALAE